MSPSIRSALALITVLFIAQPTALCGTGTKPPFNWDRVPLNIHFGKREADLTEAEIAFVLKDSLNGPGVTAADVMAATAYIAPCFEIVDSRIRDWKIGIVDTVSDNASCGVFILGEARADPRELDLPGLHVTVTKNGAPLSEGYGAAVQGSPAAAVAWLANTLGAFGVTLDAGDIILSGSLVPLADAVKGDVFEMTLHGVGSCTAKFV